MKLVSIQPIIRGSIEEGCSFYLRKPFIIINTDHISTIEPHSVKYPGLTHVINSKVIDVTVITFTTESNVKSVLVEGDIFDVRRLLIQP